MTLFGWDASDYDWARGPMDLGAAARDGASWFTHKCTEGSGNRHVHYGEALARARTAGIPVPGAYHVVRSGDIGAQVRWFLANLDQYTPWWRDGPFLLQADVELWPYDQVTAAQGVAFCSAVRAATGRPVVLYASKGEYGNGLPGVDPLWNARYIGGSGGYRQLYAQAGGDTGPGWGTYSGRTPVMWQFTSSAQIGSQPGCDANAFRGSLDQLLALVGAPTLSEEATMFVAIAGDGTVYLCDGMHARPLTAEGYGNLKTLVAEGLVKLNNDVNHPRGGFFPGAFGALDAPAVQIDVPALATSLTAAGVGQVDVVALATALEQHLPSHITLTGTLA